MTKNIDPEKIVREIKRKTRRTVQVAVPVQPPEAALAHLRLHRLEVLRIEIEGGMENRTAITKLHFCP